MTRGERMNKSLVTGLVIGVAVAAGAGALASFKLRNSESDYAKVIEVTPLTKTVSTPRQSCHDETVNHQVKPPDTHQVIGTEAVPDIPVGRWRTRAVRARCRA